MRSTVGCLLVLVSVLSWVHGLSSVSAAPLPGEWTAVETEHFLVVGDGEADILRETAVELERIRSVLMNQLPSLHATRPNKLLVFAARDERTQARLLPDVWGDGAPRDGPTSRPVAVFRRSPYGRQVILRTDYIRHGEHYRLIYHETFHALAFDAGLDLPTWLEEGYAEVWGTGTRLRARQAHVGRAYEARLIALRRSRLIPLEELLVADSTSAVGRARSHSEQFYAQAWALTHMLLFDNGREGSSPEIERYLELLAKGAPRLDAAREAFGDLDRLRRRLRLYVNRRSHDFLRLPLPPVPAPDTIETRSLSSSDAAAFVARHLSDARSLDALESLVEVALTTSTGSRPSSRAFEAAGLLHARRGDVDAALHAFESAIEHTDQIADDTATALSYYGVAVMRMARAPVRPDGDDDGGGEEPEPSDAAFDPVLREAQESLLRALTLDDDFAPAYARLAEIYRRIDEGPERALALARRAVRLRPDFAAYRLLFAQLLALSGDREAAHRLVRAEARAAMASNDDDRLERLCRAGSLRGFAELVSSVCERAGVAKAEASESGGRVGWLE